MCDRLANSSIPPDCVIGRVQCACVLLLLLFLWVLQRVDCVLQFHLFFCWFGERENQMIISSLDMDATPIIIWRDLPLWIRTLFLFLVSFSLCAGFLCCLNKTILLLLLLHIIVELSCYLSFAYCLDVNVWLWMNWLDLLSPSLTDTKRIIIITETDVSLTFAIRQSNLCMKCLTTCLSLSLTLSAPTVLRGYVVIFCIFYCSPPNRRFKLYSLRIYWQWPRAFRKIFFFLHHERVVSTHSTVVWSINGEMATSVLICPFSVLWRGRKSNCWFVFIFN